MTTSPGQARRRRVRRTMVTCAALALVAGAAAAAAAACVRTPSCHDLVEEESWAAAKVSCRAELDAGGSAATALDLARALMNSGDDAGALEMATRALQAGPSTAALRVAGTAQDRLGGSTNIAAGREKLHAALAASEEEGDDDGVARAAMALAGSFWRESRFEAVDRWLRAAESTPHEPDARTRGTLAIQRGDLQRRLGDADAAEATYARAEQHLRPFPTKLGWLLLKRGKLHLERGSPSAARPLFEEALQIADAAGQADVQRAARVSLAEVARLEGDTAEGFTRLEGWSGARPSNYLRALALLHVADGDPTRAEAILGEAIAGTRDAESLWELHFERGRVLEQLRRAPDAESAYRASIGEVEKLRASLQGSDLQPWLLARRRQPYEALFRMLAERGETHDLLRVLESLTARSFLDFVTDQGAGPEAGDPLDRAAEVEALRRGLLVQEGAASEVGGEALVVVEADGRVWTIHRTPSGVVVENRADSASVREAMRALDADPSDAAAAERLGERLVPASVVAGDAILHIVPAGDLLRVPWAALRRHGKALVTERAVAIAPSLALLGALSPAAYDTGSLVLGDPDGTLRAARDEARQAADALRAPLRLGAEAGRAALYEAPTPWVLHIASHASSGAAGASLRLADGPLTAGDVLEAGLAARVAVLSGCATGKSRTREMWGSLSAALLANGTGTVLATLRSVDDDGARALIASAYRHGLARDPVRALAAAQREALVSGSGESWSSFVAYDIGTLPR